MKTLAWLRLFQDYASKHDKRVFSVTELAHLSGSQPPVLRVALHRLVASGAVVQLARGLYGSALVPVGAEELLRVIDAGAYITGWKALFEHGHVTQAPRIITCFTNRRHLGQRRTAVGTFELLKVEEPIYSLPEDGRYASAEQALADFVYRCLRRGLRPEGLVTLRRLDRLRPDVLEAIAGRYPATVRGALGALGVGGSAPWARHVTGPSRPSMPR